jgi:hypothetical protein
MDRRRLLVVGADPARGELLRAALVAPGVDVVVASRERLAGLLLDAEAARRPFTALVIDRALVPPAHMPVPVVAADPDRPELVREALDRLAPRAAAPVARPGVFEDLDLDRPFRELKRAAVAAFERRYLEALLAAHDGNLAAAARAARVDRKNLWTLARKYGIDLRAVRGQRRASRIAE